MPYYDCSFHPDDNCARLRHCAEYAHKKMYCAEICLFKMPPSPYLPLSLTMYTIPKVTSEDILLQEV